MPKGHFHRTTEAIPHRPWKSKALLLPDLLKQARNKGMRGLHARHDAVFLHSIPSNGPPVVQSYLSLIFRQMHRAFSGRCSENFQVQQRALGHPQAKCCPGQSAEMCWRIFVVQILENFPGDFPGGFFWALFPTKMRRKNPARKSAKKSGGPKKKSAKNPFCRKPALKNETLSGTIRAV